MSACLSTLKALFGWSARELTDQSVDISLFFLLRRMIQQHSGALSMLKVQQELYVTERTLQRMFEMHVGVSPKTYGRICQFDAALRRLSSNGFTDMAGVAFQHGYADQSHLIRAFRDFTGLTPLEYQKAATDFPS